MTIIRFEYKTNYHMPATGGLVFMPHRKHAANETTVLPKPFTKSLVDGIVEVDLEPTGDDWVWSVTLGNDTRFYAIPDHDGIINHTDLIPIAPSTLDFRVEPSWWAELRQHQQFIADYVNESRSSVREAIDTVNSVHDTLTTAVADAQRHESVAGAYSRQAQASATEAWEASKGPDGAAARAKAEADRAEIYRNEANTHRIEAGVEADRAETHATHSETQADRAQTAATNAATSEENAEAARDEAITARDEATTARDEATTGPNNAADRAETAATNAATSEENAEAASDAAAASADRAETAATNAATSEENAETWATLLTPPSALTATTTEGTATDLIVRFGTVDIKGTAFTHDKGRITFQEDGYYLINANIGIANPGETVPYIDIVLRSSTTIARSKKRVINNHTLPIYEHLGYGPIYFRAGQYVELEVRLSSLEPATMLEDNLHNNRFGIYKLMPA